MDLKFVLVNFPCLAVNSTSLKKHVQCDPFLVDCNFWKENSFPHWKIDHVRKYIDIPRSYIIGTGPSALSTFVSVDSKFHTSIVPKYNDKVFFCLSFCDHGNTRHDCTFKSFLHLPTSFLFTSLSARSLTWFYHNKLQLTHIKEKKKLFCCFFLL
jgi:hypothetical protein